MNCTVAFHRLARFSTLANVRWEVIVQQTELTSRQVFTRATLCTERSLPSWGVCPSVCPSIRYKPVLCLNG